MKNHSIVFIDNNNFDNYPRKKLVNSGIASVVNYFTISPYVLPKRICLTFMPPFLGDVSRRVYIDFVGPCLAMLTLSAILHYGNAYKLQSAALITSPTEVLIYYCTILPCITFLLAKVGCSSLSFAEVVALLGYGLYGHIFTLVASQVFDHEQSNTIFFVNLLLFGGLSGLRIVLVLLYSIPHPAARFIVSCLTATVHLIFVIFVHFAYMHSTFVYGSGSSNKRRF